MLFLVKPVVVMWVGLNALDDLASVMKISRLVGSSLSPFRRDEGKDSMCDLCDDVVAGLMAGSEGVQAVPCSWMCLRVPKCMNMCESIKDAMATSSKFPCVAAGYCTEDEPDEDDIYGLALTQMECEKGPLWSCEPKKYCRRQRTGWKYTCNPKPGIGRWVGMQQAAAGHTAALAAGILSQKRCGEPDAGPFCVLAPSGTGKIAEILGALLTLFYAGYKSIVAIETPGGDDDQQWLTFWMILVGIMFLEQVFMRVLLSKFPFYYETKLLLLIWLMLCSGSTFFYRRLRRKLAQSSDYFSELIDHRSSKTANRHLEILEDIGGDLIRDQLAAMERMAKNNPSKRVSSIVFSPSAKSAEQLSWEYDYSGIRQSRSKGLDAAEKLFAISKWLLSSEGMQAMETRNMTKDDIALLLERAAALVSFNPRYLNIHLVGTKPDIGDLPLMDRNGKADCYVKFSLRDAKSSADSTESPSSVSTRLLHGENLQAETSSRVCYKSVCPIWNEKLELYIKGGAIESDGNYRDVETKDKLLVAEAWDADIGVWGRAMDISQALFVLLAVGLLVGHVTGILDSFLEAGTVAERAQTELGILFLISVDLVSLAVCYMKSA
ncbi:MAG: hypothetical protein SGILL_006581, partial [Bacillariaceae sp.]